MLWTLKIARCVVDCVMFKCGDAVVNGKRCQNGATELEFKAEEVPDEKPDFDMSLKLNLSEGRIWASFRSKICIVTPSNAKTRDNNPEW